MKNSKMHLQYRSFEVGKRIGFSVLVLVMALGFSGVARADWSADTLGEGSGLDRGAMMSGGEASLRASIERTTQMQQMVNSFDYSASAGGSFGSPGIGVMAVSAGDDSMDMGA